MWATVSNATMLNLSTASSLRSALRPADDAGDLADVVERLLGSVAYGDDFGWCAGSIDANGGATDNVAPVSSLAVTTNGRWRHGALTGLAAPVPNGPRLLGAAARAADRRRRATLLREQIVALETAQVTLTNDLAGVEDLGLTGKLVRAQTVLEQTEAKRKEAESVREAAVSRWWICIDTGLPGLRGISDPAARHVTAALESAREARSAISIRDWPDSEHQHLFPQ